MENKKIVKLSSNTYAEALRAAVETIREKRKSRGVDLKHRYILFVPDKYTLLAEKLLYSDGGAFDAEVLTLNRLFFRVREHNGREVGKPLSRLGAILTVRRLLSEHAGELQCFKGSERFTGFAETIYDNICQLASAGLRPNDLPDDVAGVTGRKLHDIKLLYTLYERATFGKYVDAAGRLLLLDEMLGENGSYFGDTDAFFACFEDFTALGKRIVSKICASACSTHLFTAKCELCIRGEVEEYEAVSRTDELKAAAARIRGLAAKGMPYGQMAVIAHAADFNRLSRIFGEYGIPFFTDKKYPLTSHPLAKYILDLFAAQKGGTVDRYITLAKNPYSGITRDSADKFENYINLCAMSEYAVRAEFAEAEGKYADSRNQAEEVRAALHGKVSALGRKGAMSGEEFCAAVERALPEDCPIGELPDDIPIDTENAREKIAECLEVIREVYSSVMPFDALTDALKESFSAQETAVLPNLSDTVEVGEVSVFRASEYDHLFVLGLHDGELPQVTHADGILSDRELDELAAVGTVIEPKIETLDIRAEKELISVLSSSKNLFLSYVSGEPVSQTLMNIRRKLPKGYISFGGTDDERIALAEALDPDKVTMHADLLLRLCPTPEAARELYLIGARERAEGGDGLGYEPELSAVLGQAESPKSRGETVEGAKKLYAGKLSVSRVQEFFSCPMRCFFKYALRLTPKPDGEISVRDIGEFLHAVIEKYIRECIENKAFVFSEERVRECFAAVAESRSELLRGYDETGVEELVSESVLLARAVVSQIVKGEFTPALLECEFGKKGDLESYDITLADGSKLTLDGVIDRLDVCKRGNAARIIDYKTGSASFSASDIYYGKKVQLATYMAVAVRNGYAPAGMFYFPLAKKFDDERRAYRLIGIFDEEYAYEMDRELAEPQHRSEVVAMSSTSASSEKRVVLNRRGKSAVSGETLRGVCGYAEAVLRGGADEMTSGYCEASPLDGECKYCDYAAACLSYGRQKRERKKSTVDVGFLRSCTEEDGK